MNKEYALYPLMYFYSPNLTWRDLQYVVLMTAKPAGLHANDWITNAVGRRGKY